MRFIDAIDANIFQLIESDDINVATETGNERQKQFCRRQIQPGSGDQIESQNTEASTNDGMRTGEFPEGIEPGKALLNQGNRGRLGRNLSHLITSDLMNSLSHLRIIIFLYAQLTNLTD